MIWIAGSPAGDGRALLDKRPGCLPVVFGAAGLHLMGGFAIEQLRLLDSKQRSSLINQLWRDIYKCALT